DLEAPFGLHVRIRVARAVGPHWRSARDEDAAPAAEGAAEPDLRLERRPGADALPVAQGLGPAEGQEFELLETILDGGAKLAGEGPEALLGGAVLRAQRLEAAEHGVHRVEAGRLVAGQP